MMSLDVASWSLVSSECCSLEIWSSSTVELQPNPGFVHLKSPFLCVNTQPTADRQHLVNKVRKLLRSKNGARKSLGEKLPVLESFRRLQEVRLDKRLYRLVLDCGLALVWHLQSPVEDLSVL